MISEIPAVVVEDTEEEAGPPPAPPVEELVIEDVIEPSTNANASDRKVAEIATFTRSGH